MSADAYHGPVLCNPNGRLVSRHTGRIEDQDDQVREAVRQVRKPIPMGSPDRVYFPFPMRLRMDDGTVLSGCSDGSALSFLPREGTVLPILCAWDGSTFFWVRLRFFKNGRIEAEVHRNPPDPAQEDRKPFQVVTPPAPAEA